jgi:hypothetical protein
MVQIAGQQSESDELLSLQEDAGRAAGFCLDLLRLRETVEERHCFLHRYQPITSIIVLPVRVVECDDWAVKRLLGRDVDAAMTTIIRLHRILSISAAGHPTCLMPP